MVAVPRAVITKYEREPFSSLVALAEDGTDGLRIGDPKTKVGGNWPTYEESRSFNDANRETWEYDNDRAYFKEGDKSWKQDTALLWLRCW